MSSIPPNKAELVEAISRRFEKLLETLAELPAHLTNEATMAGHEDEPRRPACLPDRLA